MIAPRRVRIDADRADYVAGRTEAGKAHQRRLGNRGADRARQAECRRVDRAEWRGDEPFAPARGHPGPPRRGSGEVLVAELRRRQDIHEDGETEGGNFRPLRSVTRRDHTQLTQRYAYSGDR